MFFNIPLTESLWWKEVLLWLNTFLAKSELIATVVSLLADVFVFLYPVFLIAMFLYGIKHRRSDWRKNSLLIFLSSWCAYLLNFVIKILFAKQRPDVLLDLPRSQRDDLVLSTLPESTFPSDHAWVSMAFGTATLIIWLTKKNWHMIASGLFFVSVSLVMWVSRIAIWVHRPTDILAGWCVGVFVAVMCQKKRAFSRLDKHIMTPLILIQQRLWRMAGW